MSYHWGRRSLYRLEQCHPLLQALFLRVIRREDLPFDLTVLCGQRLQAEQDAAYKAGTSKLRWPNSQHNMSPSLAVDVAPFIGGAPSWDWKHYNELAPLVKDEWGKMVEEGLVPAGESLTWGGDWKNFKDGPHWEL